MTGWEAAVLAVVGANAGIIAALAVLSCLLSGNGGMLLGGTVMVCGAGWHEPVVLAAGAVLALAFTPTSGGKGDGHGGHERHA